MRTSYSLFNKKTETLLTPALHTHYVVEIQSLMANYHIDIT